MRRPNELQTPLHKSYQFDWTNNWLADSLQPIDLCEQFSVLPSIESNQLWFWSENLKQKSISLIYWKRVSSRTIGLIVGRRDGFNKEIVRQFVNFNLRTDEKSLNGNLLVLRIIYSTLVNQTIFQQKNWTTLYNHKLSSHLTREEWSKSSRCANDRSTQPLWQLLGNVARTVETRKFCHIKTKQKQKNCL
jgi:hypothetical protein